MTQTKTSLNLLH